VVLLLENVRNYLRHDHGNTMRVTLDLLNRAGYSVHHAVLNASMFGVPQKRERLFFVCFRNDLKSSDFSFPAPCGGDVALEDILLPAGDSRLEEFMVDRPDIRFKENLPQERQNRPLRVGTLGKGGQGERIYSTRGHAVTLSAHGGGAGAKTGLYLVGDRVRRLHPVECQRAMGFTKSFRPHPRPNVCFKQFGNSVAVPVVRAVWQQIHEVLGVQKMVAA
jgi:DNA (cytosine-5)-methyltransferase 1